MLNEAELAAATRTLSAATGAVPEDTIPPKLVAFVDDWCRWEAHVRRGSAGHRAPYSAGARGGHAAADTDGTTGVYDTALALAAAADAADEIEAAEAVAAAVDRDACGGALTAWGPGTGAGAVPPLQIPRQPPNYRERTPGQRGDGHGSEMSALLYGDIRPLTAPASGAMAAHSQGGPLGDADARPDTARTSASVQSLGSARAQLESGDDLSESALLLELHSELSEGQSAALKGRALSTANVADASAIGIVDSYVQRMTPHRLSVLGKQVRAAVARRSGEGRSPWAHAARAPTADAPTSDA